MCEQSQLGSFFLQSTNREGPFAIR